MLTVTDMQTITAAIDDYTRTLQARTDTLNGFDVDREDSRPLDVELLAAALDTLLDRLGLLSIDGAKVQINEDTLPFGLLYRLRDITADTVRAQTTTPLERSELLPRLARAHAEIDRLRLILIPDETGTTLRITVLGDTPNLPAAPDYPPAA